MTFKNTILEVQIVFFKGITYSSLILRNVCFRWVDLLWKSYLNFFSSLKASQCNFSTAVSWEEKYFKTVRDNSLQAPKGSGTSPAVVYTLAYQQHTQSLANKVLGSGKIVLETQKEFRWATAFNRLKCSNL